MSKTKSVSSYRTSFSSSLPLFIHSPTLSFSEFLTPFKTWIIMSVILSSVHQVTSVRMVQFSILYNQREGKNIHSLEEESRGHGRDSKHFTLITDVNSAYHEANRREWNIFLAYPFHPSLNSWILFERRFLSSLFCLAFSDMSLHHEEEEEDEEDSTRERRITLLCWPPHLKPIKICNNLYRVRVWNF